MPKPAKTKIKLDSDSFQTLLQEIYNDILSVQKKARSDMEERKGIPVASTTDAFQIGKVNNESLKIIDSSVDKKLALAIDYLSYIGNKKYNAEQIQQEFYKLGCEFDVFTSIGALITPLMP
jgi:hypothetical protein